MKMKTKMRKESLSAYEELKALKRLQPNEQKVIGAIENLNGATDLQVANYLGWPINCVTGRRNSLEKAGLIYSDRKVRQNGRMVNFWKCGALI